MDIFLYYFDKKLDRNAQTNIQTHTIRFQLSVCHEAKSDKAMQMEIYPKAIFSNSSTRIN